MQHPTRTRALLVLVGLLGAACSNGDSNNDAAEVTTGNNSTVTPATLSTSYQHAVLGAFDLMLAMQNTIC